MSSSSDCDKDSEKLQPKFDNPFIKFRQSTDHFIGSLLQGIIGLPTALRNPEGNTRWAEIDEELKRRDLCQARQRELRDSEARGLNGSTADEVVSIPVKKSSDWNSSPASASRASATGQGMADGEGERDDSPDLYSPVTKLLFAHLKCKAEDEVNWKAQDPLPPSMIDIFTPYPRFFHILKDQESSDEWRNVQYMVYNNLNETASGDRLQMFHSKSSLIPYILFSPYSPLALTLEHPHRSATSEFLSSPKVFEAFEDLISLSQGRPMVPQTLREFERSFPIHPLVQRGGTNSASYGMEWIYKLWSTNLLWPREDIAEYFPLPTRSSAIKSASNTSSSEPQTEQDMYDRFLRSASSPSATSSGVMESLFTEAERLIDNQLRALEQRRGSEESKESSMLSKPNAQLVSSSDTDRVVSTMTTTSSVTHEDGTVETDVWVQKLFADGRVTQSSSNHIEHSARGEKGDGLTEWGPNNAREEERGKSGSGKKGWFWN